MILEKIATFIKKYGKPVLLVLGAVVIICGVLAYKLGIEKRTIYFPYIRGRGGSYGDYSGVLFMGIGIFVIALLLLFKKSK